MSDERSQKNELFGGSAPVTAKAEYGSDVPVHLAPVPSNGVVYPANHPLHNKTHVEFTAMSAREEDILASPALIKKGTVITELIRSCLVDKSIDPLTLLIGDRNALMVAIRSAGYGAEYTGEVQCSERECEAVTERTFDLERLEIRRLSLAPVAEGVNEFETLLPVSGVKVRFKFMTGADEEDMAATADKQKKLNMNPATVTSNLLRVILSVDGDKDRSKISKFVSKMPAKDSLHLRNLIRREDPGILMKQESTCTVCGQEASVDIPMNHTFLWPSS